MFTPLPVPKFIFQTLKRVFCVQIYAKLQSFIQLFLTLTKLYHIKRDHPGLKAHCATDLIAKDE